MTLVLCFIAGACAPISAMAIHLWRLGRELVGPQ